MSVLDDLSAAVEAQALPHFDFCTSHDYEDPDPDAQPCKHADTLEFPASGDFRDDVQRVTVEIAACPLDLQHGVPLPLASIGYNGQFGERDMEWWKLEPLAYAMLAAFERARGDVEKAHAYMDAAQVTIVQHIAETEQSEPVYVVAEPRVILRDAHNYDHIEDDAELEDAPAPWPTPKYVTGFDLDDGVITYDEYEVRQSVEAGIPQFVIHRGEDGVGYIVVGALDSRPVDSETYGEFADAKTLRDRLNSLSRAAAKQNPPVKVVEGDCGHYLIVSTTGDGGPADDVHYTSVEKALTAARGLEVTA